MNKPIKILAVVVCMVLAIIGAIAIVLFISMGYLKFMINGPKIAMSQKSPNGDYEAYVVDKPSIDPPNQTIYIDHKDGKRFKYIANLAEDVDGILEIHWSPKSDLVVFQTCDYLIGTRVPGYDTVMVSLGREWVRSKPDRRSTFGVSGVPSDVEEIDFTDTGVFRYRLSGSKNFHSVTLPSGKPI